MKVLVVGSGGREHALCTAIKASPLCDKLYCAPGNAGILSVAECLPVNSDDIDAIKNAVIQNGIDFVLVGPEVPLALGLVDALKVIGIACFGPEKGGAELESSKGFMKDLCMRVGIPTAKYKRFSDVDAAKAYLRDQQLPIVIKADGLAAGKGVTIARTYDEAFQAVQDAMVDHVFGASGAEVVIEEFMEGEEASFFALCDGKTARFFASAQDHKAAFDGDKGPNTGGMGAYSPAPIIDEAMQNRVMAEIINPTVAEMNNIGCPFIGVLFAGLMLTETGPKLVEFNVRFGDPETEVMIPRLKSDLLELLYSCSQGNLGAASIEWKDVAALGVVMAAKGYPGEYSKGSLIQNLAEADRVPNAKVYHAGTMADKDGKVLSNGGRVLCVTATAAINAADDPACGVFYAIAEAQKSAYQAVEKIDWPDGFYRSDIGWRAVMKR